MTWTTRKRWRGEEVEDSGSGDQRCSDQIQKKNLGLLLPMLGEGFRLLSRWERSWVLDGIDCVNEKRKKKKKKK